MQLQLTTLICIVASAAAASSVDWVTYGLSLSPYWEEWEISSTFTLGEPWNDPDYAEPECFHVQLDDNDDIIDPTTLPFDAQEKCPLCKGLTESLPGYAADPYDCQYFYSCAKYGNTWVAYRMKCPDCQFWNQEILTCVMVDPGVCHFTVQPWSPTVPAGTPAAPTKTITCIDFETGYNGMQGQKGIWVYNDGVQISSVDCVLGDCGRFNGNARLDIAYFSNNWKWMKEFSYTMFFKKDAVTSEEGIFSNDCFDDLPGRPGNSMYATADGAVVNTGLKKPIAEALNVAAVAGVWNYLALTWDGEELQVYINNVPVFNPPLLFSGPIRASPEHCPLVIGKLILPELSSFFNGLMDEICFYNKGLTAVEIDAILNDPTVAYTL